MFQKNDKALISARKICLTFTIILAIAVFVGGIVVMNLDDDTAYFGLLIWAVGAFLTWLSWVFSSLYLSYLADIKLIRNKLYDVKNDALKEFLEEENKQTNNQAQ